jgi:large subunit ribosomal protein L10
VLEFKGGIMEGAEVGVEEIRAISRLPARDVLHAQLVGTVGSPVTGLVRGLNQLIAGLATQLGQIAEQGLVSGEAEPEAAPSDTAPAEPEAEKPEGEQPEPEAEPEPQAEAEVPEPEAGAETESVADAPAAAADNDDDAAEA